MNISPQELAQRLAEADRRRVALRRATLELAAMGRQRLELRSKRENDDIDLNDPVAVLLAALQALERRGIKAAAYGGLALAEKEPAMKRRNRFPKGWNEAGGRAQVYSRLRTLSLLTRRSNHNLGCNSLRCAGGGIPGKRTRICDLAFVSFFIDSAHAEEVIVL